MRRRDQIERAGNEANTAFTLEPREARRVRADVFELAQFAAETDDAAQLAECLPLITYTAEDEASLSRSGGRTLAASDWARAAGAASAPRGADAAAKPALPPAVG